MLAQQHFIFSSFLARACLRHLGARVCHVFRRNTVNEHLSKNKHVPVGCTASVPVQHKRYNVYYNAMKLLHQGTRVLNDTTWLYAFWVDFKSGLSHLRRVYFLSRPDVLICRKFEELLECTTC